MDLEPHEWRIIVHALILHHQRLKGTQHSLNEIRETLITKIMDEYHL